MVAIKSHIQGKRGGCMKRRSFLIGVAAIVSLSRHDAVAGMYPDRPVQIFVGLAPGNASDVIARTLSEPLAARLGQFVVVNNRPGASTTIAGAHVSQSTPDGYTLLYAVTTGISAAPVVLKQVPYDTVTGFTPISLVGKSEFVLVIRPDIPARTLAEFVTYARSQSPGTLRYGGVFGIVPAAQMNFLTGIKAQEVPAGRRGESETLDNLRAGDTEYAFLTATLAMPHVQSGILRAIAINSPARSMFTPELPTMQEAGVHDYVSLESWAGILGPPGLPPAIVDRLSQEIAVVLKLKTVRDSFARLMFKPESSTPDELKEYMALQHKAWKKVAAKIDYKP